MDAQLKAILEEFWSWRLKNAPEFATAVGYHEKDDKLDDHRLEAYANRLEDAKEFLADLDKIESDKLNQANKLNLQLLKLELNTFLDGSKYNCYLFPINSLEGPQLEFARTISWMKQEKHADFEKILSRYDKFPKQADQFIELLKKGVETGYVNSKISMSAVLDQLKTLVETPAKESRFFEPFYFKEVPKGIEKKQSDTLQEKALKAINGQLYPAFTKLHDYIKETYVPACRDVISCTALPSGDAYYNAALKFHITTDMTADEVHNVGTQEVERIRKRMLKVMEDVGFEGTLEEFLKFLREDPQFYYSDKDKFMQAYKDICLGIEDLLTQYFNTIPKAEYVILETPAEGAANAPGAFYLAGSQDGSRPGTFYVNTYKFEKRPNYEMRSLSLHEAIPGHHLQASIAIENEALPSFRRFLEDRRYYKVPGRFALYNAYIEGWALYCEYLGEEMKIYENPYDLFGRLSSEIFRACRLVVDTGMHMKDWTRQQAVDYMTSNSAMSAQDISAEVDRYITWPGQACSYKIGEIKIRELREKAESALGEKFDLKLFHDAIVLESMVPMAILESIVDQFIEDNK